MLLADMSLTLEPAWPWSLPTLGLPALLGAAALLGLLTVWTYLGVQQATWRRVGLVLLLRLSALAVAFSMMMRPSFAFTELEGVETTKLLVVVDRSSSMGVAESEGKPTRWEQAAKLWESREVQRRIERLRDEQQIEVVKYLGAEDLRPDQPDATPTGKRTDIGAWLRELRLKHGHEKHLRGVVLVSDGADNGTRFSAQEEARAWRGIAPIQTFGVGDPDNPRFRKDIGLTRLTVAPDVIPINSKMTVKAIAQAPGFKGAEVEVAASMEAVVGKRTQRKTEKVRLADEKDQPINVPWVAPDEPGEYKLTVKIAPHPDEANPFNNEISTYVQVIKPQLNVLWVDRRRVYEPTHAIRFALAPEPRVKVYLVAPPAKGDPFAVYEFDQRHYDVIVIGDVSAKQFSLGNPKVFEKVRETVLEKKTGLLMLGGTETLVKGGWDKQAAIKNLLPVKLDVEPAKAEFNKAEVQAVLADGAPELPFLNPESDSKKNAELWTKQFDVLEGYSPLGSLAENCTPLLRAGDRKTGDLLMAAKRNADEGYVVVFAPDSTWQAWRGSKEAVMGYKKFWKQLVFWLARQQDQANQLVLELDRRRLNANADEILAFTVRLRGKDGSDIPVATFKAKVVGPEREYAVNLAGQRGTFQGAKEAGEHRLVVEGKAGNIEAKAEARFLVAFDDIELLRPIAEHETLAKIAANGEGRFRVLDEAALVQYLDELRSRIERESRHKTTHWPDWTRLPASEQPRDQLTGLWNSFGLVSFTLFVALLGCEWLLRRLWGLV